MLGEDVEKGKPELEVERQTRGKDSVTRTQDHLSPSGVLSKAHG